MTAATTGIKPSMHRQGSTSSQLSARRINTTTKAAAARAAKMMHVCSVHRREEQVNLNSTSITYVDWLIVQSHKKDQLSEMYTYPDCDLPERAQRAAAAALGHGFFGGRRLDEPQVPAF
jgi:hypothetical protein